MKAAPRPGLVKPLRARPGQGNRFAPLSPPLPTFLAPALGHRPLRGGLKHDPVPRMCVECGRALVGSQRKFCSTDCAAAFFTATLPMVAAAQSEESKRQRAEKARIAYAARRAWNESRSSSEQGRFPKARTAINADVIRWYSTELQPHLASVRPVDIARALAVSKSYSIHLKQGRVPHPRHFAPLAKLAGVPLPKGLVPRENATPQPEPSA